MHCSSATCDTPVSSSDCRPVLVSRMSSVYFKPCLFKASCQRKTDGADYWASWHCKILDSYGSCRYLDACSVIQVRKSEKVESVHPAVAFSVQVTHPGDLKKSSEEE